MNNGLAGMRIVSLRNIGGRKSATTVGRYLGAVVANCCIRESQRISRFQAISVKRYQIAANYQCDRVVDDGDARQWNGDRDPVTVGQRHPGDRPFVLRDGDVPARRLTGISTIAVNSAGSRPGGAGMVSDSVPCTP